MHESHSGTGGNSILSRGSPPGHKESVDSHYEHEYSVEECDVESGGMTAQRGTPLLSMVSTSSHTIWPIAESAITVTNLTPNTSCSSSSCGNDKNMDWTEKWKLRTASWCDDPQSFDRAVGLLQGITELVPVDWIHSWLATIIVPMAKTRGSSSVKMKGKLDDIDDLMSGYFDIDDQDLSLTPISPCTTSSYIDSPVLRMPQPLSLHLYDVLATRTNKEVEEEGVMDAWLYSESYLLSSNCSASDIIRGDGLVIAHDSYN
jgi:hypothetical protein